MPETAVDQAAVEETPAVVQRILIPSTIGALGIELSDEALTKVVIVPKGRERQKYTPFADLKRAERSDFLDEVLGRFSEYLAGARSRLDMDYDLGPSGVSGFAKRVLKETAKIPYGKVRTYQQIASAAGNGSAYRQVLAILLGNPLPLVVPCHRVVTVKSGPGSYVAGPKKKLWLLRLEQRGLTI
ncbi:MAG: methylated-DNA--[protein]-cysteine S-methyltransferase [Thermoanaerobaculia bacterium]